MLNKILIEGLRIFAYHGMMEQEQKVGAYFTIDCEVETDFTPALLHDQLDGTISYADLFAIIRREIGIPSRLVEHVAGRIAKAILHQYPQAHSVRIRLLKENPPMGAECLGAGVEVKMERDKTN